MQKLHLGDYDMNGDGLIDANEFDGLEADFQARLKSAQNTKRFGAKVLIFAFTLISVISSFHVYRQGWVDISESIANAVGALAVAMVEGYFLWVLFGQKKAFSTKMERIFGWGGVAFGAFTMINNILIHYRQAKMMSLDTFQTWWLNWGAILAFGVVVVSVIAIEMFDPEERLDRQNLRVLGKERETEITAKDRAMGSKMVTDAMKVRAMKEAREVAHRLAGGGPRLSTAHRSREYDDLGADDPFVFYDEPEEPKKPRSRSRSKNG